MSPPSVSFSIINPYGNNKSWNVTNLPTCKTITTTGFTTNGIGGPTSHKWGGGLVNSCAAIVYTATGKV